MNTNFVDRILKGEKHAIGRAISVVENESQEGIELLDEIYKHTGNAYRIGFTGAQGVGKSSLITQIIDLLRKDSKTIGVISVDPSSPITGGAFLGDRIRMQKLFLDEYVFIRSMATRGSRGGLSRATVAAADILDASGKDFVILETVGVGQTEIEIVKCADTIVLVFSPESGDYIQALKAGIIEFADIIVINKCDREGADHLADSISFALNLMYSKKLIIQEHDIEHKSTNSQTVTLSEEITEKKWQPEIVKTNSLTGEGCSLLLDLLIKHKNFLTSENIIQERRTKNIQSRIFTIINSFAQKEIDKIIKDDDTLSEDIKLCVEKKQTPYQIAKKYWQKINKSEK